MRLQRALARPLVGSGASGLDADGLGASGLDLPPALPLSGPPSTVSNSRPVSPALHREPGAFLSPFACAAEPGAEAGSQSPRQAGLLDRSHSPKPTRHI